jgi:hypothetical protein
VLATGSQVSVRIIDFDVGAERLSLSLLHPSGKRIDPDEAEGAQDFEEASAGGELESSGGFRLGDKLRAAMDDKDE